jgi:phage terminase small subunit
LIDLNATQAAIRAGYSAKTAEQQGPRLLGYAGVAAAIQASMDKRASKLNLTAEKVLGDIERIANKAERAKEYTAALKGKELLGKHLKLFTEKHEHGGIGGGPVQFTITEKEADL